MVKEFLSKILRLQETPTVAPGYDRAPMLKNFRVGSVGTEVNSGYFNEEYLAKLQGHKLAKEFDRMRRSDPHVKMLLSAVKNPIVSAGWEIEPASDNPNDQYLALLISHILFDDCGKSWKKIVREALTCLDFGHAPMEKTFKLVMNHPTFGTYHGLKSLDLIGQKTLERWLINKETNQLDGLEQRADGDLGKGVIIPGQYLMLFVMDMEGANYEGISWLRPCYGNWFRKNLYLKLNGIGIEKFAVPTPVVTFPQGKENDDSFENLLDALEVYTSGEANYLTKPSGYEIELQSNAYDPTKVEFSIDKEDERMTKAFLANFLSLGTGGNAGAYALSNDLSDFFFSGITYIADELAEVFNKNLIPELVKLNKGPQAKYPKLKHTGISDKAGKELSEILTAYAGANILTPDDQLEEHLRKRHKLPKMSAIGVRKPAPPSPFGGPPSGLTLHERVRKRLS